MEGNRHSLPFITMMTEHGDICDVNDYRDEYSKFIGMIGVLEMYSTITAPDSGHGCRISAGWQVSVGWCLVVFWMVFGGGVLELRLSLPV